MSLPFSSRSMIALCMFGMFGLPAKAQAGALSLEEVLQSVDSTFPSNIAARADREAAKAEQLAAEGGFDTTWKTKGSWTALGYYQDQLRVDSVIERPTSLWGSSFFVGWRYGDGKFPSYYRNYESLDAGELRAGANLPLLRNGSTDRRRTALQRAELGTEIGQLGVLQQRLEAQRAAAGRYWSWVASGMRVQIARDLLDVAQERDKALERRVISGEIAAVERTENARGVEQRRSQFVLAERGLQQSAIELGLYLRTAEGQAMRPDASRLPSDFPAVVESEPSSAKLAQEAAQRRPEPQRLALQRKQNAADLALAKNQMLPALDLQLLVSKDVGHARVDRPDLKDPVLELGVVLEVPLETRALRGRRDVAAAGSLKLAAQEQWARDRVRAEVDDALSARRAAVARVSATKEEVRLAHAVEQAERTRFEQGDGNMLIVNQREQLSAEARLRELEARLDVFRAEADIVAATAKLPGLP